MLEMNTVQDQLTTVISRVISVSRFAAKVARCLKVYASGAPILRIRQEIEHHALAGENDRINHVRTPTSLCHIRGVMEKCSVSLAIVSQDTGCKRSFQREDFQQRCSSHGQAHMDLTGPIFSGVGMI
ncbi:hypothetical protein [Streptomyces kronopolitis]|uniref:hypothetical protein n=1 Tax=Streptomyces kronopolitis TaxID=1612435 RepID=UPI0036AEAC6A